MIDTSNTFLQIPLFSPAKSTKSSSSNNANIKHKANDPIVFVNPIKQIQCNFKIFTENKRETTEITNSHITKYENNQKTKSKKKSQYVQTFNKIVTDQQSQVEIFQELIESHISSQGGTNIQNNDQKSIQMDSSKIQTIQSILSMTCKPILVDKETQKNIVEIDQIEFVDRNEEVRQLNQDYELLFDDKLADLIGVTVQNDNNWLAQDSRFLSGQQSSSLRILDNCKLSD